MTNNLVVIINKVPKIKKILPYEMKFLVPNYTCLQNPWLGDYHPQIPVLSVLNWICWTPPPNKIPGYATVCREDRTGDHISLAKQGQCATVYGVGISSFGSRIRVIFFSCQFGEYSATVISIVQFSLGTFATDHMASHPIWHCFLITPSLDAIALATYIVVKYIVSVWMNFQSSLNK